MILKKLRLKNIRSYTDEIIKFPIGSTLLAGDIGTGKSSILLSVEFALFGAMRGSVPGEALLRKGENEGEVELEFELEGRPITIRRKLKRQRGSVAQDAGFISINNTRIDGTTTELKARLLDLLGYPKELLTKSKSLVYRYTVYTPQEEMKQILFESDELRVDTLRKVFGIDRYKRIANNTSLYIRSIKEQKKELGGIMLGLDEKKSELRTRKEELEVCQKKKVSIRPMLESIQEKKNIIKEQLTLHEKGIAELNDLKKQSEVLDARLLEIVRSRKKNNDDLDSAGAAIQLLKSKLEKTFLEDRQFPPTEDVEKVISGKENELKGMEQKKTELTEKKRFMLERLELIKKEHDARKEKLSVSEEKESMYSSLREELKIKDAISRNVEEVNNQLKQIEKVISELTINQKNSELLKQDIAKLDTCPTCKQDVSQVHKQSIINEEDRRIKKLMSELEDLTEKKTKILEDLDTHNSKLKALTDKEHKLAGLQVEISAFQQMRRELEKIKEDHTKLDQDKLLIIKALEELDDTLIDKLKRDIAENKDLLRQINQYNLELKEKKHNLALLAEKEQLKERLQKEQEELKHEVSQINTKKTELNASIATKSGIEKEFQAKKSEFDEVVDKEKDISIRIGEINKEIEGINTYIISLQKDIQTKECAGEKIKSLNSIQEWLEQMFINLMTTMEKQVMARVHTQFSELFSDWFNLLIADDNISVRIDDTFSPIITQNGYDTDINHLSGGEKTSIALAYRLALNRVINDLISNIKTRDLIILDEPTDGFSTEQLDKVRDVLEELNVKQTIIVSHESKIESFVDNIIRIQKDEHVSRVVS